MGRWVAEGQRDVFVPDDDAAGIAAAKARGFAPADGSTVSVVDPYGHQTVVDQGVVERDQERGVDDKVESNATVIKRAREERLKDETSTVGTLLRAGARLPSFGLSDNLFDAETLEADKLHHSTANTVGEIAGGIGSLIYSPEAQFGKLFGVGSTVGKGAREVALAEDALTAEQLALSSKAVLGGEGASAAERSLVRTGRTLDEATATKAGIDGLPADLIGMDAKALKQAAADERAALKAAAGEEKAALEADRVPLRKQAAEEAELMHRELMEQRPIFKAVAGDDVRAIPGVKDIASQLNKSYRGMRSAFDNPIAIAENPEKLIGHLQMRQTALESLQKLEPELRAKFATETVQAGGVPVKIVDHRLDALAHVGDALEQTKAQINTIKSLGRANPVSSTRLAELESGASARLTAIEAAQEALKQAPEMGLIAKGAQAAVFGGVTSLAHAIPGLGALAPFIGKVAGDSIGRTFESLGALKTAAVDRSKQAISKFLDVTSRAPATAAVLAGSTAKRVLSEARFSEVAQDSGKTLASAYKARSAELRSQTAYTPDGTVAIRPEARAAIAKRLAPIAQVNPLLADKLETIAVRKTEFLSSVMPRRPDVGGLQIGPDNWSPNSLDIRSWARSVRAAEDPASVEEDLAHGIMTPEAAVAYRTVYPERFAALQQEVFSKAPSLSKTLPMTKKIALSIFTGVPLMPAMQPNVLAVLQGNFAVEPEAPKPRPNFGALGSARSPDKQMTASQQREGQP